VFQHVARSHLGHFRKVKVNEEGALGQGRDVAFHVHALLQVQTHQRFALRAEERDVALAASTLPKDQKERGPGAGSEFLWGVGAYNFVQTPPPISILRSTIKTQK
jgi:hypothetical protein